MLLWHYLQHDDTGTLMASTIQTMSILLKQMVMRDGGESTVGPELLPGVQGSWVVAGTCLFWKLPLAVERGSEPFTWADASSAELLLEISPPYAVTFPNQCPWGALSVLLPRTSSSVVASSGAVWLLGIFVGSCVLSSVDRAGVATVEVRFFGGTGASGGTLNSILSPWVGGSFDPCTSLRVMVWCACSLSFRPNAGSASFDKEEREDCFRSGMSRRLGSVDSSTDNFWGSTWSAASVSPLSDPGLDRRARGFGAPLAEESTSIFGTAVLLLLLAWLVLTVTGLWTWGTLTNLCMWPWLTTSELGSWGRFRWLSVLTVFGVTAFVSWMGGIKANGWRAAVGRMMSEGWVPPLGDHSPLLEPSWCQSEGRGWGADRGLLWAAAMWTGSWDVWLRYSSCADDTSPTDSARNARTPAETERESWRLACVDVEYPLALCDAKPERAQSRGWNWPLRCSEEPRLSLCSSAYFSYWTAVSLIKFN